MFVTSAQKVKDQKRSAQQEWTKIQQGRVFMAIAMEEEPRANENKHPLQQLEEFKFPIQCLLLTTNHHSKPEHYN